MRGGGEDLAAVRPGPGLGCAGRGIIKAFTGTGMHLHTFAARKRLLPIRIHEFRQRRRPITPHIPIETGHITHRLTGAPLSTAIIPFRNVIKRGNLIETSQTRRLLRTAQIAKFRQNPPGFMAKWRSKTRRPVCAAATLPPSSFSLIVTLYPVHGGDPSARRFPRA